KKLYHRTEGLAALERSAMAAVGAWRAAMPGEHGPLPARLHDFLELTAAHVKPHLAGYPWYCDADPQLPLEADAGGARIAAAMLARCLTKKSVRMAGIWCEPLMEGHFNQLMSSTQNKSTVAMTLVLRLIYRVAQEFQSHEIHFWIDKQGGRDNYREALMRAFEGRTMRVVEEGNDRSIYHMPHPRGASPWQVGFCME